MTKEEFMELIEGFENEPFVITIGEEKTPPLRYVKVLSDSVKVISNGKPSVYQFAKIGGLSFDIDSNSVDAKTTVNTVSTSLNSAIDLIENAKKHIVLHSFSFCDRTESIRQDVRDTEISKEWGRVQNIIKDAKKNHVLQEKSKSVIVILKNLIEMYPCIEVHQMLGEAYSYINNLEQASLQFEMAGDYQNALFFAQKCGDDKNQRIIDLLSKWIILQKNCDNQVYSTFFYSVKKTHNGRLCYELIKNIDISKCSEQIKTIIFYGLVEILSDYINIYSANLNSTPSIDQIKKLLEMIKSATVSESYTPVNIEKYSHASELYSRQEKEKNEVSVGFSIGYIISKTFENYGYIGKDKNSSKGIRFGIKDIVDKELIDIYRQYYTSMDGMKVYYTIEKSFYGEFNSIAKDIRPAEDVREFLSRKGINLIIIPEHNDSSASDDQEYMLKKNEDGTYSGYIIKFLGSCGFINKDPNETRGIFFYSNSLSGELLNVKDKIEGLKVKCKLTEVNHWKKGIQKNAIDISSEEDLVEFLESKQSISTTTPETIEEKEIDEELKKNISPATVVQKYATSGKPLHALIALEKSKDSFTYDKYVKHKIQLLQRTKTDDGELIKLLNYTVTTSQDGSYIAHNLFFLGQVQYRCKQYMSVIQTMKRLQRYKSDMKNPTMYYDSIYYMAVSYYMVKDYANSDQYSQQLQKQNIHLEDARRLLDRTFASEIDRVDIDETDGEFSLQFDTEVKITPFIEQLINEFSFGSISLEGIPYDFDPESDNLTEDLAETYVKKLINYSRNLAQRNNPNAYIAIAKIEKWISKNYSGDKKEKEEEELRRNISNALQIMARSAAQQSGMDIRVHLFYRMQQYEMSVQAGKSELFNAYVNAHFGVLDVKDMKSLKISDNLKNKDYILIISDILLFYAVIDHGEDEKKQLKKLCNILENRYDKNEYQSALSEIMNSISYQQIETNDIEIMFEQAIIAIKGWLVNFRKNLRDKSDAKKWNDLLEDLDAKENIIFLTEYERQFIKNVHRIVEYLHSAEINTATAVKQSNLYQSYNLINEMVENLKENPTYILYSIFTDMFGILKNATMGMLSEVMSHIPNIISVGSLQVNLGLTDMREFILPLEFQSKAPSVQAQNFKISIDKMSSGIELQSELPNGQNINENEKYSQSLKFRFDSPQFKQVNISVKVEYTYDTFDSLKSNNERVTNYKIFDYTVSFQDVPVIKNKYSEYAHQQIVKDESMFFGRDQIIKQLFDSISVCDDNGEYSMRDGNGIVLYGQRRSGKTSILYHLQKKIIKSAHYTIIVDLGSSGKSISKESNLLNEEELQNRNSKMTLQLLYQSIISKIRSYINFNRDINEINELYKKIKEYEVENETKVFPPDEAFRPDANCQILFNNFWDTFSNIICKNDTLEKFRVVIMIDEFTYFNAAIQQKYLPNNFMEILKAILAGSLITLVVAGQDNTIEFMDQYVNEFMSFHKEWVTFLGEDDSYKMVTEPIGENRIDPDAAKKLYIFTKGSPFLLMDVCSKLVNWMNENKILKLSGSLPDDFLTLKYMKDYEFKEDLLEPQYKDAGRTEWTPEIKMVLGLIARSTSKGVVSDLVPWNEYYDYATITDDMLEERGILSEKMHEILERLVKRDVIERQDGYQDKYRIKIPLCREWILRRGGTEYGNE